MGTLLITLYMALLIYLYSLPVDKPLGIHLKALKTSQVPSDTIRGFGTWSQFSDFFFCVGKVQCEAQF
jgi:hypothetical protein